MNTECTRKRSPNWLTEEKELLVELIELNSKVIESKEQTSLICQMKRKLWMNIAEEYNQRAPCAQRSLSEIKCQWKLMKNRTKQKAANIKARTVGNGRPPVTLNPLGQRVMRILSENTIPKYCEMQLDHDYSGILQGNMEQKDAVMVSDGNDDDGNDDDENNEDENDDDGNETFCEMIPLCKIENTQDEHNEANSAQSDPLSSMDSVRNRCWESYVTVEPLQKPMSKESKPSQSIEMPRIRKRLGLYQSQEKEEAIDIQNRIALEENERAKALHDLEVQIKKEKLKQEKIRTNLLLAKHKKLLSIYRKRS